MTIAIANAPDTRHVALLSDTGEALKQARDLYVAAREAVRLKAQWFDKAGPSVLDEHQFAVHGLAWFATYVRALEQLRDWAVRLDAAGTLSELEACMLEVGFGEYLAQLDGGVPMNLGEIVRPADLGVPPPAMELFRHGAAGALMQSNRRAALRARISVLIADDRRADRFGQDGLADETSSLLRAEIRRFVEREIAPFAHEWHTENALIPMEVVSQLAGLGVFGVTIAEADGGLGLGKLAMCVVTEELARGYIGVGSLGTRAEIAAELIMAGGTPEQKATWLPRIASGDTMATAVFTEPDVGSDLGSLKTRARFDGTDYRITGSKTWITHAARADLMIVLARTDPDTTDYRGLSMFLAPKTPAGEGGDFPDEGLVGAEIEVLGYRGMREYDLRFDDFKAPASSLLGGSVGTGFKQLMRTFESARIQTAARAVGVAQNALELGLRYSLERQQFGKAIVEFPRVGGKLAMMAVETLIARQLTYYAARQKDLGQRCDVEAGMAKLLAARVAWSNADNALQIHGGNGYAVEFPISRVLCDARILNIFEGAAEIQAQVIGRGLLERQAI